MARTRKVAHVCEGRRIRLIETPLPELQPGWVLVEVHRSLVSPGSELGGWENFGGPDNPKTAPAEPTPFGYSNAGVVAEIGEGVKNLRPGDRVCAIGMKYALHADYAVVPRNLCVKLPETVTFDQGAYGMLLATALHAVRRGRPELGDYVAVVGLGLVGQLAARLYQLAGAYVIGWDLSPLRCEIAERWGIDAVARVRKVDAVAATAAFTRGQGLDAAVLAVNGEATEAYEAARKCMKISPDGHPLGRMIVVGQMTFTYKTQSPMSNLDLCQASRTGPGYHDEAWELGADYPPVFMRWNTQNNLELCMRLIAEGKVNVDALTTHAIPFREVEERLAALLENPGQLLGVIFEIR